MKKKISLFLLRRTPKSSGRVAHLLRNPYSARLRTAACVHPPEAHRNALTFMAGAVKLAGALLCGLILFQGLPAHAETYYGDETWNVTFNGENQMVSSFKTSDINDVVGGMQPGDNVIITLSLKNDNRTSTDWYMKNEVLYSLEDRSANGQTKGGAYTYRLSYQSSQGGEENVLFDSDTVGGENVSAAGEGLKEATSSLKEYFYLDTLSQSQSGVITLEVALDGETQGNDYQDTLADLQMEFAVELRETPENPPGDNPGNPGNPNNPNNPNNPGTPGQNTPGQSSAGRGLFGSGVVKTGDESRISLFSVLTGGSGLLLLLFCIWQLRESRKNKAGKEGDAV